jgi:hypothetical protein
MGHYAAPLRDMQFVLHELLDVTSELKAMPAHADVDADTINHILDEGGKFTAEVLFPSIMSATMKDAAWTRRPTRSRPPRASRRPTGSSSTVAGRR